MNLIELGLVLSYIIIFIAVGFFLKQPNLLSFESVREKQGEQHE